MRRPTSDLVAVILAAGIAISVVALVIGVTVGAIKNGSTASTLSDNESQVLTAAFGGMIGVLGAWVGYRAHERRSVRDVWPELQPPEERTPPHWPDRETTRELPPEKDAPSR